MATIAPFRGSTYQLKEVDDISRLMAPPYDVISEEEQESYYESDPHNIIRLILGKNKIGDSDWDNRYTRAGDELRRWELEEILTRTETPSIYVTSMTYDSKNGSGEKVRWGWIALARIEDEKSGVIMPHERTFSAHREDRLKLTRACNAQLSQVFGLYEDPANEVFQCFQKTVEGPPEVSFDFKDGTSHEMWIVKDEAVFKRVSETMLNKSIFIADGHHRYETARNYRNIMRARFGRRPPNRAYEFVMMYLSNMDDVGLTILPSHRLIKRYDSFGVDSVLGRIKEWFEIQSLPVSSADRSSQGLKLKNRLEEEGREKSVIGFLHHGGDKIYLLSLKPGMRHEMGVDLQPSLRQLDVLVLSRLILQKTLGFSKGDLDDEAIFHYQSEMGKVISLVNSGNYDMAFLLNPTKMEQVKEVAKNALIMPRKSTYFYPKVLTGLVMNKINPHEVIRLP